MPADSTFSTFSPQGADGSKLPLFLFEKGFGCTVASNKPLIQAIANQGFLCIVPERPNDLAGGCEGMVDFVGGKGLPLCTVQTDGTSLLDAYKWAKENCSDKCDLENVAIGGYSMGAVEVVNAVPLLKEAGVNLKAIVQICASLVEQNEPLFKFKCEETLKMVEQWPCPSLWLTAESETFKSGGQTHFEKCPTSMPKALIICKDSALDLELPNSKAGVGVSHLYPMELVANVPGFNVHLALASEEKCPIAAPAIAFLSQHLKGAKEGIEGLPQDDFAEVVSIGGSN